MTAATMEPGKIDKATLDKLRARIREAEQGIEQLKQSLEASRRRKAELMAERQPHVLPAKLQKDVKAQERLRAIDQELGPLTQGDIDEEVALSELSTKLKAMRNDLEVGEWERDRAEIRKLLEARLDGRLAGNIERAAGALAEALKKAEEEDERLIAQIVAFEPTLHREAKDLRLTGHVRGAIVAMKLRGLMPIDDRAFNGRALAGRGIAEEDRILYNRVLASLNRLELVF